MFEKGKLLTAVPPVRQRPPEKHTAHRLCSRIKITSDISAHLCFPVLENNHFPHPLPPTGQRIGKLRLQHFQPSRNHQPQLCSNGLPSQHRILYHPETNGYFTIAMYYRMCIPAIPGKHQRYCSLSRHRRIMLERHLRTLYHRPYRPTRRGSSRYHIPRLYLQAKSCWLQRHRPLLPIPAYYCSTSKTGTIHKQTIYYKTK